MVQYSHKQQNEAELQMEEVHSLAPVLVCGANVAMASRTPTLASTRLHISTSSYYATSRVRLSLDYIQLTSGRLGRRSVSHRYALPCRTPIKHARSRVSVMMTIALTVLSL